jgi:hypothetical protein
MKSEEILQVVKERYCKAPKHLARGQVLAVVRAQPRLAASLQYNTVFTIRRIWHLSRNSLSSFREVVVTL